METKFENTPKSLFRDKEHYLAFVAAFKKSFKEKESIRTVHFMFYALMRNKDWRKCFTPCTNKNKLANGYKANRALNWNLMSLRGDLKHGDNEYQLKVAQRCLDNYNEIFGGTITKEMMEKAHEFLPLWDGRMENFPEQYAQKKEVTHV